jgi:endonuclease YncB( thermonuclease family)
MVALVGSGSVMCQPQGRDRYGRMLAHCSGGNADLGGAMVTAGLAVADGQYYHEEALADAAKAGIWAGPFTPPRQWRESHGSGEAEPGFMETIRAWFR